MRSIQILIALHRYHQPSIHFFYWAWAETLPVLSHSELLWDLVLIQSSLLPLLRMRSRQEPYHPHCTRAWVDPELASLRSSSRGVVVWIFGGSLGPNGWCWYITSIVVCVVCLPSRVSSLKSLLSATNCTNGPGVMFDGMTALVWAVPHSVLQSHNFLRPS